MQVQVGMRMTTFIMKTTVDTIELDLMTRQLMQKGEEMFMED